MSSQPINDETAFFLGNWIQEQKGRVNNSFLPPKLLDRTHNVREVSIPFQLAIQDFTYFLTIYQIRCAIHNFRYQNTILLSVYIHAFLQVYSPLVG